MTQRPTPDLYNISHVYYFYFSGDGSSETFNFTDGATGDNYGQLNIEIYQDGGNTISHNNVMRWNASSDMESGIDNNDIHLKVIPYDNDPGTPAFIQGVHVDLNIPPSNS